MDISLSNICSYLYGTITDRRPSGPALSRNISWGYGFRCLRQKTLHAWKFFAEFRPRKVSASPKSSSLKFCAAILPARQQQKIGQAFSPYEKALVLINNVLTSETKGAKKKLFSGSLHALSSKILKLPSCRQRKSFLRGS